MMSLENILEWFWELLLANPVLGLLLLAIVLIATLFLVNKGTGWSANFTNVIILITVVVVLFLIVYALDINFNIRNVFSDFLDKSLDFFVENETIGTKGNLFTSSTSKVTKYTPDTANGSETAVYTLIQGNGSVVQ